MLLSSLNEFIRDTKQCKHHCCHWKPLLEAVMSYNICFSSSLVTTERVAASLLLPLPVWFYAFDPRRTSRFTFLAFRPQSLLGYLLSPPALSTIISQQERSAAARPGGGRWDTFDSKRTHGNSGITLIFFFTYEVENSVSLWWWEREPVRRASLSAFATKEKKKNERKNK